MGGLFSYRSSNSDAYCQNRHQEAAGAEHADAARLEVSRVAVWAI
jgi:hypothetical protein